MTVRRALAILIGAAVVLIGSTARAADEIGLSNDGVTWSSSLPAPLFDPDFRWVPGDSETATFYVRNQGPSGSQMVIQARSSDTDELLANEDIDLQARVVGEEWVPLRNGVPSRPLTERSIGQGAVVQIEVNATFDPASTNQSQLSLLPLSFSVTLTDALEGPGTGDRSDDHLSAGGLLPETGAARLLLALTAVGAVSLVLGSALLNRRQQVDHG